MRRILIGLSLGMLLLLMLPAQALACNLVLKPSTITAKSGESITFRLERYKTHKVCVTPLEDTKIIVTGGELIDPGKWVEGNPDVLNFTVKFTSAGSAVVRVERYCTKVGLMHVEAYGTEETNSISGTIPPSTEVQEKPGIATPSQTTVEASSPSETSNQEGLARASSLLALLSKITFDSLTLQLWYLFFLTGLLLFLFKLQQVRKLLLFVGVVVLGFYLGGCPEPVGTPFILLLGNSSMFKIALILLLVPLIISMIWGRVFCGWICPLGGVQEITYTDKINFSLPPRVDKYGRLLKYLVLAAFLFMTWKTGVNYWGDYEPFKVLFNFDGTTAGIVILVITLAASVVIERPFCRYLCPLGAVLALSSRLAPYRIRLGEKECKGCKLCAKKTCPVNAISMPEDDSKLPLINNNECIRCLNCLDKCKFKALFVSAGSRKIKPQVNINEKM
ncbi:MAG: 4Fe-4S binding protein [Syntrophomonadaceae bacterium]